jgi:hypothetical protein
MHFDTIQKLSKKLLIGPLGAFSGDFPYCLIGTFFPGSRACKQLFLKNPMVDARTAFRAKGRAKQRPRT